MTAHCQIRVWDVSGGLCQHLISHHSTTVLALAFSPDDRLLVTLGQWQRCRRPRASLDPGGGCTCAPDAAAVCPSQGTTTAAPSPCGARPPMTLCPPPASRSRFMAWPSTPGTPASSPVWARALSPSGSCSNAGQTSAFRCQVTRLVFGPRGRFVGWNLTGPWDTTDPWLLVPCQVHREQVPETVGAGELTSLCYGAPPLLYCGTSSGQVCVWDTRAGRCFLSWEADDGGIGECPAEALWPSGPLPGILRTGAEASSPALVSGQPCDPGPLGGRPWPLNGSFCPQGCCCVRALDWSAAAAQGGFACGLWGLCRS